jgi:ligand-binding sensor domain-containing protein
MIKLPGVIAFAFLFFVSCTARPPAFPFFLVRHPFVYSIRQHNDSLYFTTLEDGLFRFHPDHPEQIARVGGFRRFPFRSIAFPPDNRLLAVSYYGGVFYASRDTLLPLRNASFEAWSMKLDDKGEFWLASGRGVLRQKGDTVVVFNKSSDAHDVAFYGNAVAVAHMRGITLYDRESRSVVGEYCKGVICWTLARFDSVLVGGGSNVCIVIGPSSARTIRVPPLGNMPWSIAKDSTGALFMGTQKGLFRVGPLDSVAQCIGCKGKCVKSVCIDNSGRLWVGTFFR